MKNLFLRTAIAVLCTNSLFLNAQYDPNFSLSINAGGPQIDHLGQTYLADQYFTNGVPYSKPEVNMDPLYETERYSTTRVLTYAIPVKNGLYDISLHFAEIYYGATGGLSTGGVGSRIFDVRAEGQLLEDNMDIFAEVGAEVPLIKNYVISVYDGSLDISMSSLTADGGVDYPKVSAIQVNGVANGNWDRAGNNISYTDGNVGIGTVNPGTYKLAVNGSIHARAVNVDLNGWADYVFEKDYRLPSLEEVERHIQEKGHLINIPSAMEVEANGIELGEMDRLLLEKIEELTLYILEQEKRISHLENSSIPVKPFKQP
jgi:hypothetical protein